MPHLRETLMQTLMSNLTTNVPPAVAAGRILRDRNMPGGAGTALLVYQEMGDYKLDDVNATLTDKMTVVIAEVANAMDESIINDIDLAVSNTIEADITLGGNAIDVKQISNDFIYVMKRQELVRECKDGSYILSFDDIDNDSYVLMKRIEVLFRTQRTNAGQI